MSSDNENKPYIVINKKTIFTAALVMLVFAASFFAWNGNRSRKYDQTAFVMGTVFNVSLATNGEDPTPELINIGNELDKKVLSWRSESSEIAAINSSAGSVEGYELSEDMEALIVQCLKMSAQTDGAFDITVGALTKLWDIDGWASGENEADGAEFVPPSKEEIDEALNVCGYEKVKVEDHRIYLPYGMSLDLGAVGKGIYLDKCKDTFDNNVSGIVSAGGSILTCGKKPDGGKWNIGINDPFGTKDIYGSIEVDGEICVSTSGPYERFVTYEGVKYHHILDPHTGYPADTDLSSVTIVSQSGLISDALSTACFVLGEKGAYEIAEEYGAEIYTISNDGSEGGTITLRH